MLVTALLFDAFFFEQTGTKKKALQKRNAVSVGSAPTPRKLLKKFDQNFTCTPRPEPA